MAGLYLPLIHTHSCLLSPLNSIFRFPVTLLSNTGVQYSISQYQGLGIPAVLNATVDIEKAFKQADDDPHFLKDTRFHLRKWRERSRGLGQCLGDPW